MQRLNITAWGHFGCDADLCVDHDDEGDYVLHSEAQAEIARLQAEVERLRKLTLTLSMERHVPAMRVAQKMHEQQVQATDDYMALLEQASTSNSALEEVAEALCLKLDALLRYTRHHASCQAVNPMLRGGKCTCGLEEVLK